MRRASKISRAHDIALIKSEQAGDVSPRLLASILGCRKRGPTRTFRPETQFRNPA